MIPRNHHNNPLFSAQFDVIVERHDNTLVIIDHFISEVTGAQGVDMTIGTGEGDKLIVICRNNDGSQKAYSMKTLDVAALVLYHHENGRAIPHLRPITSADAELEAETQAELEREPTPEELAAATAGDTTCPTKEHRQLLASQHQINFASYNRTTQVLRVEFKQGAAYNYQQVPPDVWENFKASPSAGSFLASNIKGIYQYSKADGV